MDALCNVHRMLVKGGVLVESHPLAYPVVEKDGAPLGRIRQREFPQVLRKMEKSLTAVVRAGLFVPIAERRYDVVQRFDAPDEIVDHWEEVISERLRTAILSAEPPLEVRHAVVMRSYETGATGSPTRTRPGLTTEPTTPKSILRPSSARGPR